MEIKIKFITSKFWEWYENVKEYTSDKNTFTFVWWSIASQKYITSTYMKKDIKKIIINKD